MTIEEFKNFMEKYNFRITASDSARGGDFFIAIETAIEIFEEYGDDIKLYELEQLHKITKEEYKELIELMKKDTINWEDFEKGDNPYLRCHGINKNGERCCKHEPHSSLSYMSHKDKLEILRKEKYYCSTHKQQEDVLLKKVSEIVYGGK